MADIRINSLPTTASASSSDDFLALDGATNGTRKLNAYSPTFGGNLTVSGTGTTGGNLSVRNALGYATGIHTGTTSDSTQQLLLSSNAAYNHAYISKGSTTLGIGFSSDNGSFVADDSITITAATKLVTLAGNLTLSGATSTITLGSTNTGSIAVDANGALIVTPKAGQYTTLSVSGNSGLFVNNGTTQIYLGNSGGNAVAGTLNANDFLLIRDGAVKLTATATGVDIYGNLTVSGTGTSSVAGKFGVGSTSPNFTGYGIDTAVQTIGGSGSLINGVLELYGTRTTDAQLGHVTFGNSGTRVADIVASRSGANDSARLEFWTANAGTLSLNALLAANGNFLIGTTTDSANGKLQLATHTTSAGGIGFGTDTSLYRSQTGMLALDGLTGSLSQLDLRVGGVQKAFVAWNGGDFYLGAVVGTTVIKSSNTTALTLDSSQNATFAGTSVTVDGASTGSTLTLKRASNANGAIISYKTTTTSKWYHGLRGLVDDNWYLQNDVAGNTALFFDASTSDATFAGYVKIANTAQIKGVYTTTTTFDFGTIANNDASSVCTLTMTGVSSSDSIIVSPTDGDNFPQFCTVSAVPSGNSVSVRLYNGSGSSRTVGSRSIRVTAIKF